MCEYRVEVADFSILCTWADAQVHMYFHDNECLAREFLELWYNEGFIMNKFTHHHAYNCFFTWYLWQNMKNGLNTCLLANTLHAAFWAFVKDIAFASCKDDLFIWMTDTDIIQRYVMYKFVKDHLQMFSETKHDLAARNCKLCVRQLNIRILTTQNISYARTGIWVDKALTKSSKIMASITIS